MRGRAQVGPTHRPVWPRLLPWLLLGAALLSLATPAPSMAAECAVQIEGQSLAAADDPSRALTVPADGNPSVIAAATEPVSQVSITVMVWPFSATDTHALAVPATSWKGTLPVSDFSRFGAGVYQVVVDAGVCQVTGWVDVEGRSVFETAAGLIGLGMAGIGLLVAVRSILGARTGGGILSAIVGGALFGVGMLVLAQQAGISAVTPSSAVVWTALPAAIAGIAHVVTGSIGQVAGGGALPGGAGGGVGGAGGGGAALPPPTAPVPPPTAPVPPPTAPATLPPPTAPPPPPPTAPATPPVAPTAAPPTAPPAAPPTPTAPAVPPATSAAVPPAAGTVTGAGSDDRDPPRSAYAHLECPEAVVVQQPFSVVVGLDEKPDSRVVADELHRPDSSVGPYTMTIQLIAEGMQLARPGATWRSDLRVTADEPYPKVTVELVPDAQDEPVRATSIRAMYSIDGNPIGLAVRSVATVRSAELIVTAPSTPQAPGVDLALPPGQVPPDLTVRIERAGPQSSGQLLFQLLVADRSIAVPDAALPVDIGADPAADLRQITAEMQEVEGKALQYVALNGIGLTIADRMPTEFWDVLHAVAAKVSGRAPSILFLSAEPYVPWELAVVDPPLDPSLPPFLSAQATVGRWVLGQRRPPLPPPMSLTVKSLAAVSGVYELPGWQRLLEAEAEAQDLVHDHHAAAVDATTTAVLALLGGNPAADIIHFAVHGSYDAEPALDGLILVDGTALDPMAVRGTPLHGHPLVFLNACQVGQGDELLGDQAGLAAAFLSAGASAVIAPLWSIDDQIARQIAARFYQRALGGEPPAEVMRLERAAFHNDPATTSSTCLAYQYFGHPGLRLEVPDGPS